MTNALDVEEAEKSKMVLLSRKEKRERMWDCFGLTLNTHIVPDAFAFNIYHIGSENSF